MKETKHQPTFSEFGVVYYPQRKKNLRHIDVILENGLRPSQELLSKMRVRELLKCKIRLDGKSIQVIEADILQGSKTFDFVVEKAPLLTFNFREGELAKDLLQLALGIIRLNPELFNPKIYLRDPKIRSHLTFEPDMGLIP